MIAAPCSRRCFTLGRGACLAALLVWFGSCLTLGAQAAPAAPPSRRVAREILHRAAVFVRQPKESISAEMIEQAALKLGGISGPASVLAQTPSDRDQLLCTWLGLAAVAESRIDPTYDSSAPENMVCVSMSPPSGGYPSGTAPEAIEEPEVRAQYEAMLKENKVRGGRRNEQMSLRNADEFVLNLVGIAARNLYTKHATDRTKFRGLVDDSRLSAATKAKLATVLVQK